MGLLNGYVILTLYQAIIISRLVMGKSLGARFLWPTV